MSATVTAVISSFRPAESLIPNVDSIRHQVGRVIVVDDGSGPDFDDTLSAVAAMGAEVIRLPENLGIAHALNAGLDEARSGGADFVVTFDQDSSVQDGFVDRLMGAWRLGVDSGHRIGFVVPEFFGDVRQATRRDRQGVLRTDRTIQSGMLIPFSTIDTVGTFLSELFIDLVDTDFELRCDTAGLPGAAAAGLRFEHALGGQYRDHLFPAGSRFPLATITLSTPFRYYYRARNRIVINKIHGRQHPLRLARDTVFDVIHFVRAALIARPRRILLSMYRRAIRDAVRGKLGRAPDAVMAMGKRVSWAADKL
ncbi:glycosyltransferase [Mycetocola zhujimingii]|uniref:glycosyltransferase n=1 Tax=Mycetocola zhujimingii TaxID=2079792 RepID=UPI000D35A417|nr:glycosyltransferase [Mycetocola zhujimingii]AWB85790.1 hypothetical protein C3E77_03600 [Mycetocola zhujimingii]